MAYYAFVAIAGTFALCAILGSLTASILSYLLAGVAWAVHYRANTPPFYSKKGGRVGLGPPAGISGNFLAMVLLWPVHSAVTLWICWERLKAEDRFLVFCGQDGACRFGSWTEALDFARKKAKELSQTVSIHDFAHQEKDQFGDFSGRITWVLPSGTAKKTLSPEEALHSTRPSTG